MGPPDGGGDLIDHQGCGHALHNPTQGGGGALQGPLLDGGEGRHSVTEAVGGHALKSVPLVVKGDALHGEGRGHGAEGVPEEGGPALRSPLPAQGGGENGVRDTAFYKGPLGVDTHASIVEDDAQKPAISADIIEKLADEDVGEASQILT